MAKKKLLNESQVRRFMGLAGIQPLNEMYGKKMEEDEMNENIYEDEEQKMEEEMYAEEEPAADAEPEPMPEPMDEPEAAEGEAAEEEVTLTQDTIDNFGRAAMELLDQLGFDAAGGEMEMDDEAPELDDEAPELDAEEPEIGGEEEAGGDEEVMEALSGVNMELNEDELVQEVARRVAKRILKAKEAQKQLDEALGRKNKRPTSQKK